VIHRNPAPYPKLAGFCFAGDIYGLSGEGFYPSSPKGAAKVRCHVVRPRGRRQTVHLCKNPACTNPGVLPKLLSKRRANLGSHDTDRIPGRSTRGIPHVATLCDEHFPLNRARLSRKIPLQLTGISSSSVDDIFNQDKTTKLLIYICFRYKL